MSYQAKCEELYKKYEALKEDYKKLLTQYEIELSIRKGLSNGEALKTITVGPQLLEEEDIKTVVDINKQIENFRWEKIELLQVREKRRALIGAHYRDRQEDGKISALTQRINRAQKYLETLTTVQIGDIKIEIEKQK